MIIISSHSNSSDEGDNDPSSNITESTQSTESTSTSTSNVYVPVPGAYYGRLDTIDKLFLSMKSKPITIGNVIIRANDFKTVYFKPWDPRTPYKKKDLVYKRIKAKFTVIAKLIRRYIQYHRQSQYLICFINSRDSYSRSRGLKTNKSEIISVMQAYLMNLTGTQEVLAKIEKILKFLEQSHFSMKSSKVEELLTELYQYEKKMQGFCIQMNDLLRNSDDMIISGSYDDGRDEPSIFLDIDDDLTAPSSGIPSPSNNNTMISENEMMTRIPSTFSLL